MSPTVVFQRGWHILVYPNEGNEPMHVHAEKGDSECKFWIKADEFEIEEVYSYRMTPALRREVRQIIYENLPEIIETWQNFRPR